MSLENGNNILDYEELANCLKKYENDDSIFTKAFMLLNLYINNASWPHSARLYEEKAEKILGGDAYWICRIGVQIEPHFENEENKKINRNFKRDLYFFASNVFIILDEVFSARINPFELNSISSTINEYENNKLCIRFSRNDNKSLDVYMSKYDIKKTINYLENLLSEG